VRVFAAHQSRFENRSYSGIDPESGSLVQIPRWPGRRRDTKLVATVLSTTPTGTRQTRVGRCSIPGQIYHIIAVTHGREPVFSGLAAGRCVIRSLIRLDVEGIAKTLAFVVMPDHLHWLMQLGERKTLSICVASMKSFSARELQACSGHAHPTWQPGYFDHALRKEKDLVGVSRYIVANPIRAGLVDDIGQYPHWDAVWLTPHA